MISTLDEPDAARPEWTFDFDTRREFAQGFVFTDQAKAEWAFHFPKNHRLTGTEGRRIMDTFCSMIRKQIVED